MAPPAVSRLSKNVKPTQATIYRRGRGQADHDAGEDSGSDDDAQERSRSQLQQQQQQPSRTDGLRVIEQTKPNAHIERPAIKQIKVAVTQNIELKQASGSSEEESVDEQNIPRPAYIKPGSVPARAPPPAVSSEGSSSAEESSEEEEPIAKPLYKPVFVAKRNRETLKSKADGGNAAETAEEAELRQQAQLEERRRQSSALVGESIKRELASKEAGEKFPEVDDTDGLDAGGEFEAWKLRELMRLKREREAENAREEEREAIEARRALPEALRLKEDSEYAAQQRAAKSANRGQQSFLQKYHHKGAFYADAEVLQRYDYSAATESTVRDVSSLPEIMQVRNFGKMGRTKYTHLAKEDTSDRSAGWGQGGKNLAGLGGKGRGADAYAAGGISGGCFNCGGPHRKADCPELTANGPSGANAGPVRRRRSQTPDRHDGGHLGQDTGWGNRDDRRDRGDERQSSRRRSRSRSRSPPRRDLDRRYDRHDDAKRHRRD